MSFGVSYHEVGHAKCQDDYIENVNVSGLTSNVSAEKYTAMCSILLKVLPSKPPGITQMEIAEAVIHSMTLHWD